MPTILQLRRGTTAENDAYTGSVGELTVDTDLNKLRLHDGSTAGGDTIGNGSGNIQIGVTGNNEIDTSSGNLTIDSAGGTVTVDDNLTVSGNLIVSGTTTTVDSTTIEVQNQLVFEGSTSDDFELTLTAGDPTADRTITLPDATDTLVGKATTDTLANKTLGATTIAGHLTPDTNETYDLGSSSFKFRDIYLSGTSINLGDATITADGSAIVLPANTTISGGDGAAVDLNSSQTLTNKTLTSAVLNTGVSGTAILDEDNMASDSATQLATQQSIKAYVDAQVTASDLDFQGDSGGALSIDLDSETFTVAGGTAISTSGSSNTVTVTLDDTAVSAGSYGSSTAIPTFTVDAQGRLTAAGTASISSNMGIAGDSGTDTITVGTDTFTIAGGTGLTSTATTDTITLDIDSTVATLTDSQTLTNKTIDSASNTLTLDLSEGTLTGTTAEFNSALSDGSFATLAGTETLTNKTISGASNTLSNIANSSLTNSSITIGSDSISLGATQTDLNGITSLDVDNITIDGSTISTTNINGDLTLNPNGSGDVALSSDTIKYGDPDSTDTVFRNAGSGTLSIQNTTSNITVYSGGNIEINPNSGNTVTISGDTTVSTNLTVSGNLTVNGTTTTVASTNTTIADNLIELNSGAASNANDTGILIERGSTGDNAIMA